MRAIVFLACFAASFLLPLSRPISAQAQHTGGHDRPAGRGSAAPAGEVGRTQSNLAPRHDWPSPVDDEEPETYLLTELLEYRAGSGSGDARWDVFGWHGGDYDRLWLKSEGGAETGESAGEADFQVLYGRLVSPFFDFQLGLRYEERWTPETGRGRAHLAVGVQGLAPYYFDVEPTLFVSQRGDVSARFTVTYDVLLSQRLVLQPRFEGTAAWQENEDFQVGSGVNTVETGLRVRYEIMREFAPYIGLSYENRYGETAQFLREEGGTPEQWLFVSGLRLWL
jgi:copper resistance protein B